MKTKKLIILLALLLSGIIVSAQGYSEDNSKMKLYHDQTSKPLIELSEVPSGGPDITSSFGSWWQLLKLYVVQEMVNNKAIDTEHWVLDIDKNLKRKDRRVLPPLPGPNRHRATKRNNVNCIR